MRHPLCHVSFTQAINKEEKKPDRGHVASTISEKKFKTTGSHSTPNCESSASASRPPSKAKFRAPVTGELYANCKQCNITSPFKGLANRDQSIEYKRSCPNCKSEVVVSPAVKPKTLKRERRAQRRSPVLAPECVPVLEQQTQHPPVSETDEVPALPDNPSEETQEHQPMPECDQVPAMPDHPIEETQEQVNFPQDDVAPRKKKFRMCGSTGPTLNSRLTWCEQKIGHLGKCHYTGASTCAL